MQTITLVLNFQDDTHQTPEWLMIIPAGYFAGRDNRGWINSRPDQVIALNQSLARDIVVDFEHATARKAPKGEPAPASG